MCTYGVLSVCVVCLGPAGATFVVDDRCLHRVFDHFQDSLRPVEAAVEGVQGCRGSFKVQTDATACVCVGGGHWTKTQLVPIFATVHCSTTTALNTTRVAVVSSCHGVLSKPCSPND